MIIGYTAGVFDLFHIGHLRLLLGAKGLCDRLIVGVSTDDLVLKLKGCLPTIPLGDRLEIVRELGCVDIAVVQYDYDKYFAWKKLKFDVLFIGDDHYGEKIWMDFEKKLKKEGVKIVFLPYTKGLSSMKLRKSLNGGH